MKEFLIFLAVAVFAVSLGCNAHSLGVWTSERQIAVDKQAFETRQEETRKEHRLKRMADQIDALDAKLNAIPNLLQKLRETAKPCDKSGCPCPDCKCSPCRPNHSCPSK